MGACKKFIKTKNKVTYEKLKKDGYEFFFKDGETFVFLNSKEETNLLYPDIVYTNSLEI